MTRILVANIILLLALYAAASETKGWVSRSLRQNEGKIKNQKFTTKPKTRAVLGTSPVTVNIELREGKRSPYDNYFTDPEWRRQWLLHDYRTVDGPVMDHNVVPVYERGFHGQNVRVVVVDDGVVDHYDLKQSYDRASSLTCSQSDVYMDGEPDYSADWGWDKHGTRLAGIIGMDQNDKCGVGIAFKAKLISINVYHGWYTRDEYIGQALNKGINKQWDIFNFGFGLPTSAFKNKRLRPNTYDAISNGFVKGRNGKGSIYVMVPGLSKDIENCWDDPLANHPETFAFGIATNQGKPVTSSDIVVRCSALLATAYAESDDGLPTTSPQDDPNYGTGCAKSYRSVSIGAPVASGIIALVLSANGALTSRDVMHLIVAGSEVAPLADNKNTWSVNKAGFWFSNDFGFGLLNADNMVELAQQWTPVPERHACFVNYNIQSVPQDQSACLGWWDSLLTTIGCKQRKYQELAKDKEVTMILSSNGCKDSKDAILFLEHIQLEATIDYTRKGAPSITVVSPKGTASKIMEPPNERNKNVVTNKSLKSYHFWGENPVGSWSVKIKLNGVKGRLTYLRLTLYGTKDKPNHYKPSEPFRTYSASRLPGGITIGEM